MIAFPASPPSLPTPAPTSPAPSPIRVAFKTPFDFLSLYIAFLVIYVVAPATPPPIADAPT